ncbi:hypothetical protein PENTCL1PPCAC_23600, partial [Pristionchus entomophagus]
VARIGRHLLMLPLVMLLSSVLPLLLLICFKPNKAPPKTQVQQSSNNGSNKPFARPGDPAAPQPHSTPPLVQSSGPEPKSSSTRTGLPATGVTVAKPSKPRPGKKTDQPPSSGGNSHNAVRRGGASSAKLAKSVTKKGQLLKTPKRRNRGESIEVYTCESREKTEEATQIEADASIQIDDTAHSKDEDFSLRTAEDEPEFDQYKHQLMGNVDEAIANHDDWAEYMGDRLITDPSLTCAQPTDPDMSAIICGHFRIWLANNMDQDQEGPPQ